jgi:hypothetical protein
MISGGLLELDKNVAAPLHQHVMSFFEELHHEQRALCERADAAPSS